MRVPRKSLPIALAASLCGLASAAEQNAESMGGVVLFDEWRSGEPIPVGTADRRGPLAPGVTFWPHGVATIGDDAQPSMFMGTDRFSHPTAVYLYRASGRDANGAPVFDVPQVVDAPFGSDGRNSIILQDEEGVVRAVWATGNRVNVATFNEQDLSFERDFALDVPDLPRGPQSIWAIPLAGEGRSSAAGADADGRWMVLFGVSDGKPARPEGVHWRHPDYQPYDGRGIYRGHLAEHKIYGAVLEGGLASEGPVRWVGEVSPGERATLMTIDAITDVSLRDGGAADLMAGTILGGITYFPATWKDGFPAYEKRLHAVDRGGNAIRFPSVHAYVSAYPNATTNRTDLLVGTQGLTTYYRFTGEFTGEGKPIFEEPTNVHVEQAGAQFGALTVPSIADWDQDGVLDIVTGNSDGFVLFAKNAGTNRSPRILPGEKILAGGHPIHVQPGYYDIQGPYEARWGYSCPTTVDWDGDGDLDIVMSDPTAAHTVFINTAGPGALPQLQRGSHLYLDHLDLHGTWRVRPAAAKLGERMGYVMLDWENELRLFWRLDDHNVEDAGKILQPSGEPISGAYLSAGGTGRGKLLLHDWDEDGRMDLLVGTSRHMSVGDKDAGLPQSLGRPGSAVLWLRNVGTDENPVLEWPRLFAFKGKPMFFGQHSCAPAVGELGPGDGKNLIVGTEDGRVWFFNKEDISFMTVEEHGDVNRTVVIDKIMANPGAVDDTAGEFIRLRNISGEPHDIDGWWLYARGGRQVLAGPGGKWILQPGETLTLARSTDKSANGGIDADGELDPQVGLGNSAGILSLHSLAGMHHGIRWGDSEHLMGSDISVELVHGIAPQLVEDIGGPMKEDEARTRTIGADGEARWD